MDEEEFYDALSGDENAHLTAVSPASTQKIKRIPLSPSPANILNNLNTLQCNSQETKSKKEFASPFFKKTQQSEGIEIKCISSSMIAPRSHRTVQSLRHSSSDPDESSFLADNSMMESNTKTPAVADESLLAQFGCLTLGLKNGNSVFDDDDDDVISFKKMDGSDITDDHATEQQVDVFDVVTEDTLNSSHPMCPAPTDDKEHVDLVDEVTKDSLNSSHPVATCDSVTKNTDVVAALTEKTLKSASPMATDCDVTEKHTHMVEAVTEENAVSSDQNSSVTEDSPISSNQVCPEATVDLSGPTASDDHTTEQHTDVVDAATGESFNSDLAVTNGSVTKNIDVNVAKDDSITKNIDIIVAKNDSDVVDAVIEEPLKSSDQACPVVADDSRPFKPIPMKKHSPVKSKHLEIGNKIDPFISGAELVNSPIKLETLATSPADIDPFKIKTQLMNSPAKPEMPTGTEDRTNPVVLSEQITDSPLNIDSLTSTFDDTDPFKIKTQLKNSPVKPEMPAETEDTTNPVVPSEQIADILTQTFDDIDPFKTKTQLNNSPVKSEDRPGPIVPSAQIENSPFKLESSMTTFDDIDPFKVKTQLKNSPVKPEMPTETEDTTDPVVPSEQIADILTSTFDDIDPFKTKTQLNNSPAKPEMPADTEDRTNSVVLSAQIENSPLKLDSLTSTFEDIDPFKTKTQLMNSPVIHEILADTEDRTDLFVSSEQIANSPFKLESPIPTFDDIDPFKIKTQLKNSPVKPEMPEDTEDRTNPVVLSEQIADTLTPTFDDIDPFKTKTQLNNSPVKSEIPADTEDRTNSVVLSAQIANSPLKLDALTSTFENIDPFKTKTQLMNLPVIHGIPTETEDRTDPSAHIADSPFKLESSMTTFDDIDPFKVKTQLKNSPVKPEMPTETEDTTDPVVPSEQIADIFTSTFDDIDPFKTKTQLNNSPAKPEIPADTEDRTNSVVPSAQIADILTSTFDDIDPFKTKTQLNNSPAKPEIPADTEDRTNLVVPSAQIADILTSTFDDIDPFKTKTQLNNSPAKPEIPADTDDRTNSVPSAQIANSPLKLDSLTTTFDDIDPFKNKTQLMNSPVIHKMPGEIEDRTDPVFPNEQIVNSPLKLEPLTTTFDDIDPFKIKTQLNNSPVKSELTLEPVDKPNSFVPSAQIVDSLTTTFDDIDPFKTKTQLNNSTDKSKPEMPGDTEDRTNPFVQSAQIANSPLMLDSLISTLDDTDSFKTKIQLMNSPIKQKCIKPNLNTASPECLKKTDPFKTKTQLPDSPVKSDIITHPKTTETLKTTNDVPTTPGHKQTDYISVDMQASEVNLLKSNANSSVDTEIITTEFNNSCKPEGDVDNVTVISKLGQSPVDDPSSMQMAERESAEEDDGDDLASFGIKDDEFIPGEQIFSDPGAWDMLEKFGNNINSSKSDLSRFSLYRKFDPFVMARQELPQSPVVTKANTTIVEHARHENIDESICLLGTPPKVTRRRSIFHRRPQTSVSQAITEELAVPNVDFFLSLNPEESGKVEYQVNQNEIIEVLKYSEADWRKCQAELKLGFEGIMLNKEKEWTEKFKAVQLELKKAKHLGQEMCIVVNESESVINSLLASIEKSKKKELSMEKQLNQSKDDIISLENSFSDLHRRYERLRECTTGFKKNEETLKNALQEKLKKWKQKDEDFFKFKKEAEEKVKIDAKNFEELKKSSEAEIFKLTATLRKKDLEIDSKNAIIEQKQNNNDELIALCDTLMARVGNN